MNEENLSPEERWQRDEKNRLEYQNYCNKIIQGLEELDENSGERALWELIQNARDQRPNEDADVIIKIELTETELIFSHHGKPFDYTSFRALVKQDSSKDRNGAEQVGKYGTGFMTTHAFNKLVYVTAPYIVKRGKDDISGYFQIENFHLDRTMVDTVEGPYKMKEQLDIVEDFCKQELLNSIINDTTSFRYELTREQIGQVSAQLSNAISLLPFVMVINSNITQVEVIDYHSNKRYVYTKKTDPNPKLLEDKVWKEHTDIVYLNDSSQVSSFCCKSLRSEKGDVIIIPPFPSFCGSIENIPSLFLWFPLLGTENFGVNFIFHSERFYPVEKRNNIMLPGSTGIKQEKGGLNREVLVEMMNMIFDYYGNPENAKMLSRSMCKVAFPVANDDEETQKFYQDMQALWIAQVPYWKSIPVGEQFVCISDTRVKLLHPDFFERLTEEQKVEYEQTLASYALLPKNSDGNSYLIPSEDLIAWSDTVNRWGCNRDKEFFITVKDVCETIKTKGQDLHKFLKLMKDSKNETVMDTYALLPNRKGELRIKKMLYHGEFMSDKVYNLVSGVMGDEAKKIYDKSFLDITSVNPYSRADLQKDITANIGNLRKQTLNTENHVLTDEELTALINFCSASHQEVFNNQRGRMMPILCQFYDRPFSMILTDKFREEEEEEFYKAAMNFLLDYTLNIISQKNSTWVKNNKSWLQEFLTEYAPNKNEDRKKKLNDYGVLPNQNSELCLLSDLRKNAGSEELVDIYRTIFNKDLKNDWIDSNFESIVTLFEDKPEDIANKIEKALVEDMRQENINERKFQKVVREIILKINRDKKWESWFGQINEKKATYTFSMKSGESQEHLFALMDLSDNDLERLATLKDKVSMSELLDKMERMKELDDERTSKFNFCFQIGKYIENVIRSSLEEQLVSVVTRKRIDENLTVDDIQNGQDIIVKVKHGNEEKNIYFIEVKAKWNFDVDKYAHMSTNQLKMAAEHPDCYALCCVDLTDREKINLPPDSSEGYVKEHIQDIIANTRVHLRIGEELSDIMTPIIAAENDKTELKMRIGEYRSNITKRAFQSGKPFEELVKEILNKINLL